MSEHLRADEIIEALEEVRKAEASILLSPSQIEYLTHLGGGFRERARYYLGCDLIERDYPAEGWRLIEEAADSGDAAAQSKLAEKMFSEALCAEQGVPVPADSVKLWRMAASSGDYEAKYMLAQHAIDDDCEALRLLRESADAGYCAAYSVLGDRFYRGLGVERDFRKALALFNEAFQRTAYPSGEAIQLAIMHLEGHGTRRSIVLAAQYLEMSVRYQSADGTIEARQLADACEQVAREYLYRQVADQSDVQAVIKGLFWFQLALELGSQISGLYVARLLHHMAAICESGSWERTANRLLQAHCDSELDELPHGKELADWMHRIDEEICGLLKKPETQSR